MLFYYSSYFFIPDKIKAVYDNFISGNIKEAQHQQILADRIIHEVIKYMTIPATKVLLCEMGFDVGEATFPMKRYSDAGKKQIVADAVAAGLVI